MNQQPLYAGNRQPASFSNGERNGSLSVPGARPPEQPESIQSRAARFEDEKRRIIESCFNKRDPDGMQLESYITHVKIYEDASYPSSPPPPDSPAGNKKSRVILVAVRRSGKVRVHKARENANGTFSIGKTWPLEDLTHILSYASLVPATRQQEMEKQWATNTGFTITLGKPYFWQAPTAKEKDFFIASLIKIFRKYTGGKMPEMLGFSAQEVTQLIGASSAPTPTPIQKATFSPVVPQDRTSPPPQLSPQPPVPAISAARPQSPYVAHQPPPSRDGNRFVSQEQDRANSGQYRPYPRESQRPPSAGVQDQPPLRSERGTPVRENPRPQQPYGAHLAARDDTRTPSLSSIQQTPRPSLSPQPSVNSLRPSEPTPEPPSHKPNGYGAPRPLGQGLPGKRLGPAPSQESFRNAGASESFASSRPSTANTDRRTPEPAPSLPALSFDQPLPNRKISVPSVDLKPPQAATTNSQSNSTFVTPLGTPTGLNEETEKVPGAAYFPTNPNAQPLKQQTNEQALPKAVASEPPVPQQTVQQSITNAPVTAEPSETASTKTEEEHRPGLGPMVKKKSSKDIAGQFRRAALAAAAFQPRQGGAGARLKALQDKNSNEPDGITSVVPAPLLRGMSGDSARSGTPEVATPTTEKEQPLTPKPTPAEPVPRVQIERTATTDSVTRPSTPVAAPAAPKLKEKREESPDKARSGSPQRKRRQRLEAEVEKHCAALGIDPRILDGRGADFNELLTEFGWDGRLSNHRKVEDFETEIRREIGRAQASGWLGHVEQQESKVQELAKSFDKAIAECEELDGLLTLYAHELDTLHDDIEYIEAQGQGLQVQTANQKLLQKEMESLLTTLTISSGDLRPLQSAPIDSHDGVQAIEQSLTLLYRAMLTIDPDIRQNKIRQASSANRSGVGVYADTEIGQMRAVRQKKEEYKEESLMFMNRYNQFMKSMFSNAKRRVSEENISTNSSVSLVSMNLKANTTSRQELWSYNPIMLFVREVNQYEWSLLIRNYEIVFKENYSDQFRDYAMAMRKNARRPAGEEQEILFTHQEKDKAEESLTSTAARKLTVKRNRTVKTSALRQSIGGKQDGRPEAWNVFNTVLEQQAAAISEEQNFIVQFFHLDSQSNADFAEVVQSRSPSQRKLPNLQSKQSYDPDREMAKIVQNTTEGIYSFWPMEMQSLVEWVLKLDQMQGVGVLLALEQCLTKYEETNQEFISRTVRTLHERLTGLFHKFVEEQVKAIEETKVKVKKRKGLISFMRVFPEFSAAVEDMLPQESAGHPASMEVRFIVNDAYIKLLKAMWESLNFIAKDNPASSGGAVHSSGPSSGDPEDKEALNYHILLIENMNYFVEEVKTHHNVVLEEWSEKASHDQFMHLTQYTDAVMRRPLGKWLDFLESTEALMKSTESYASIASKPSHSRSSAKKVLSAYDAKEIRKGIETLKKRVEKHFTDADDPSNSSKTLIARVLEECNTRYTLAYDRMKAVVEKVYDSTLEIDWRKEDVAAMFKR
ncbi:uncharacterized protein A1O9_08717 [Exophiala aquamarina CBS 119918]|uniref:Exocyst complex component Sec3 PIP2-binding N-terminal domain-containing protein n=1 Tax=Exophiala aquamarina CBS 119918 TaxID=1182545 RepID=A0A072P4M2_9EURO|nr:uncharacterized protein A1O9_08717 [Exophiala aquamarina CBS 119918]KEF55064.1 hypothetical protein A1O9_08717 [Exophiala aquamarina CBS 119918]